MNASEMLVKMGDSFGAAANAKTVFGEPIRLEGKVVVPIATVAWGFGAGSGQGPAKHLDDQGRLGGGGGGGGVRVYPAGALEITQQHTRFVPFLNLPMLAAAFSAGIVFGALLGRRKK